MTVQKSAREERETSLENSEVSILRYYVMDLFGRSVKWLQAANFILYFLKKPLRPDE